MSQVTNFLFWRELWLLSSRQKRDETVEGVIYGLRPYTFLMFAPLIAAGTKITVLLRMF